MQEEVPSQLSFAHVDGDLYASITDALELIYDRLAPGAICVVDDVTAPELPRHGIFPGAFDACRLLLQGKPEELHVARRRTRRSMLLAGEGATRRTRISRKFN